MLMAAKFLLLTVVSTLCAQMVFCCLCLPQHPQTAVCMSDYVFRGKVLSKTPVYGGIDPSTPVRIVYSIQPHPIYHDPGTTSTLKDGDAVNITTAGYQPTCGVTTMEPGNAYLVSAKEIGGELITNMCAWNALFSDIGTSQRKMLRERVDEPYSMYSTECHRTPQCEVRKYCGAPDPSMCQQFHGCTYYQDDDCDVRHAYCTKVNGECVWQRQNKRYRICLAEADRKR